MAADAKTFIAAILAIAEGERPGWNTDPAMRRLMDAIQAPETPCHGVSVSRVVIECAVRIEDLG